MVEEEKLEGLSTMKELKADFGLLNEVYFEHCLDILNEN
jgi:hypothetical protein